MFFKDSVSRPAHIRSAIAENLDDYEFIRSPRTPTSSVGVSEMLFTPSSPLNGANHTFVQSFDELRSAVYPPNPNYDIAEKPWLPGPQRPYLIVNARIIDPRAGKVHSDMSLQLAGGKILRVFPTIPAHLSEDFVCNGQKVVKIDAREFFVCPGLIDCELFIRTSTNLI